LAAAGLLERLKTTLPGSRWIVKSTARRLDLAIQPEQKIICALT